MMLGEILEEIAALQGADALKNVPLFPAIVECLGLLQPRYYSISSSPKVNWSVGGTSHSAICRQLHPRMVHVTASVLQYTSRVKPERKLYGVCTNYLLAIHDMLSGGDIQADTEQRAVYSIRPAGTTVEDVPHREVRVPVFVRRSSFKLPEDPKVPIVMVGPGTGVAPFRGFVQERQWLRRQGVEVGPTLLFFGCRRRDEDYLYWEEWKAAMCEINPESYACTVAHVSARTGAEEAETGADAPEVSDMTAARQDKSNGSVAAPSDASLVGSRSATVQPPSSHLANGRPTPAGEDPDADAAVFVAFSREHPSRKHYVQHRLFELGSRVWALLGPGGGTFYVCGDAKNMAHDVYTALKDVASTMGGMSKEEASKWLKELRAAGRYMEDVWS
ncbi:MAG: hypothetical protein BJ554DRAFT_4274 [Olpidium bornovanus]|uniref:NADPH--hemoprotein reductase n=1 Tax=Olpidium bornovanus TaxID=278681 RepID=A0A8H7ZMX6_9FUNG|nr:MAG: hypothetical protein BJ554DRAFT_4274 [Olpidium bornovanus]